jgi:single-stranded-DNA-specific exonuclease
VKPTGPKRARPPARWLPPVAVAPDAVHALCAALGIEEPVAALLARRGFTTPDVARRFLNPTVEHLHSPLLMRDMDRAVERIARAVRENETVFIHGDYDVDGITSTSFLTRCLRAVGARVTPFVPHRVTDGYDLSGAGVRAAIDAGASLVITCDCGTTAREPVASLRTAGIDTIITDHHLPGGPLPDALAVLNPRRPDCPYPDKDLVAGGVAFKLALAVTTAMGGDQRVLFDMLDLVAMATVADVAPLRGENRVFVRHGLQRMARSTIAGVRAMVRAAGLEGKELTAGRVGFILAPRLNAAGRVDHAMRGIDLMLTDDDGTALGLARHLEELNRRRQDLDRATLEHARKRLESIDLDATYGLVIAGEGWHPGIIGIVASRVVEETGRPAMLIALENGVGKGSGRSIPAFDLHAALTQCGDLLLRYGGHRAAAGLTIDARRVDEFAAAFNTVARARLTPADLVPELRVDLEMPLALATESLLESLRAFEPHGVGNPAPVFVARGVRASGIPKRIGESGIRTQLLHGGARLDAIAWDFLTRADAVDWSAPLDVAFRLERDEWQGRTRVQARLADVQQ